MGHKRVYKMWDLIEATVDMSIIADDVLYYNVHTS